MTIYCACHEKCTILGSSHTKVCHLGFLYHCKLSTIAYLQHLVDISLLCVLSAHEVYSIVSRDFVVVFRFLSISLLIEILPEAQLVSTLHAIESMNGVTFLVANKPPRPNLGIRCHCAACNCIYSKWHHLHLLAPFALVINLTTKWRHWH